MEALRILERDIEERFVRSSGRGGQKVNKTSTCVFLRHLPTGIEVKYSRERSQSLNRFLARRELVKRIEKISGELTPEETKRQKRKKQKAKRQKRAKLKHGTPESNFYG
jgi:protein subunit release factor B